MTAPENGSAIGHRRRCSWGNTQALWIPQVLSLLIEVRIEIHKLCFHPQRSAC